MLLKSWKKESKMEQDIKDRFIHIFKKYCKGCQKDREMMKKELLDWVNEVGLYE